MALKFPTVKRYSGEGAESMLAFFWQLLRDGVQGEWRMEKCRYPVAERENFKQISRESYDLMA